MQTHEKAQLWFQPTLPGMEHFTQHWSLIEVQGGVLAVRAAAEADIEDIESKVLMFMDSQITLPSSVHGSASYKQISASELYGVKASPGSIDHSDVTPLPEQRSEHMHALCSPGDYVIYFATKTDDN